MNCEAFALQYLGRAHMSMHHSCTTTGVKALCQSEAHCSSLSSMHRLVAEACCKAALAVS